jgi:hypothetical protein
MARKSKLEQLRRGFREKETALNKRERELQSERTEARRRLGELRGLRRYAEVEAELVVIAGKPEPQSRKLVEIEAEIDALAAEVDRDHWGAKLEACRVARRKLAEDREDFLADNLDDILGEIVVADGEATEGLGAALESVIAADVTRQEIAGVMRGVLAKLPPPHDGSTYRLEVRNDKATMGLLAEVKRRLEVLEPLAPVELLRWDGEDEEEAESA